MRRTLAFVGLALALSSCNFSDPFNGIYPHGGDNNEQDVCEDDDDCNGNGTCSRGECTCNAGYVGDTCDACDDGLAPGVVDDTNVCIPEGGCDSGQTPSPENPTTCVDDLCDDDPCTETGQVAGSCAGGPIRTVIAMNQTNVLEPPRVQVAAAAKVLPAAPLAEMVAALLEDEGYVVMVRGLDLHSDAISHLGTTSVMTTYVLVPETQAEAATALIAETVTDYEGPDLERLMEQMASGELPEGMADEPSTADWADPDHDDEPDEQVDQEQDEESRDP